MVVYLGDIIMSDVEDKLKKVGMAAVFATAGIAGGNAQEAKGDVIDNVKAVKVVMNDINALNDKIDEKTANFMDFALKKDGMDADVGGMFVNIVENAVDNRDGKLDFLQSALEFSVADKKDIVRDLGEFVEEFAMDADSVSVKEKNGKKAIYIEKNGEVLCMKDNGKGGIELSFKDESLKAELKMDDNKRMIFMTEEGNVFKLEKNEEGKFKVKAVNEEEGLKLKLKFNENKLKGEFSLEEDGYKSNIEVEGNINHGDFSGKIRVSEKEDVSKDDYYDSKHYKEAKEGNRGEIVVENGTVKQGMNVEVNEDGYKRVNFERDGNNIRVKGEEVSYDEEGKEKTKFDIERKNGNERYETTATYRGDSGVEKEHIKYEKNLSNESYRETFKDNEGNKKDVLIEKSNESLRYRENKLEDGDIYKASVNIEMSANRYAMDSKEVIQEEGEKKTVVSEYAEISVKDNKVSIIEGDKVKDKYGVESNYNSQTVEVKRNGDINYTQTVKNVEYGDKYVEKTEGTIRETKEGLEYNEKISKNDNGEKSVENERFVENKQGENSGKILNKDNIEAMKTVMMKKFEGR